MLKWIFLSIILIIVLVVGGLYGFGRYVLDHANEEDSFSSQVYEQTIEGKLLVRCREIVKETTTPDDENTPAQYEATCKCFANDVFEKFRDVPPDELDALIEKDETNKSVENIIKKCGYAAGLN